MISDSISQISCDEIDVSEPHGDKRIAQFVSDELYLQVPNDARIISFDGFDGVGKSTLARHLAAKLGVSLVSLDEFLKKDQGYFLEALRLDEISGKVGDALNLDGRVIIEGCLVDRVC